MNWDQSRDREGRRIINAKSDANLIEFYRNKLEIDQKIQQQVEQVRARTDG